MVLVPYNYNHSKDFYNRYYDLQVGNGVSVYKGRSVLPYQTGSGFGSVLAKLAKKALPFAKVVGKRLLTEGANLGRDLIDGEDFFEAAPRRLMATGRGVAEDLSNGQHRRTKRKRPAGGSPQKKKRRRNAPPRSDIFNN